MNVILKNEEVIEAPQVYAIAIHPKCNDTLVVDCRKTGRQLLAKEYVKDFEIEKEDFKTSTENQHETSVNTMNIILEGSKVENPDPPFIEESEE